MKNFLLVILLIATVAMSATTIYDIQYTTNAGADGTYPSPLLGEDVTVQGVVTANNANPQTGQLGKFFISQPEGGAWKSIYIFHWNTDVQVGDMVEVSGTVQEYYGSTQLSFCSVTILSSGNPVPNPSIVTTGQIAGGMPAESYEGCLVKVVNVTTTQVADSHGQWAVNDGTGACFIDDLFYVQPNPDLGDVFLSITGNVNYGWDQYSINPRTMDDVQISTPVNNTKKSWGKIKSIYK